MLNKNQKRILLGTAIFLAVPLVAMQFRTDVVWTLSDFVVAAVLLLGTGFTYDFLARKITTKKRRNLLAIFMLFVFVLVWADLAVGLFNIPGWSGN